MSDRCWGSDAARIWLGARFTPVPDAVELHRQKPRSPRGLGGSATPGPIQEPQKMQE